ncbi:YqaJ viral recombinase family protein [Borrelia hispanica]|uniref:YqaJ viral recombinase family protein n=1 Tax=Borrelia hispanica TaxID=40835 RepID=UPI000688B861|nr:YqaJ viral recombinase family protein [Borrelia hispanica]
MGKKFHIKIICILKVPYKDNLHIKKGKALENLGFAEFLRIYFDNIQILHKNKYANGIDKYNYFKRVGLGDNLVGATIDGWFVNNQGETELLEIKCSDSNYLTSAITEYNQTGNFLESKYFFKYYVQAQIQLACTGLSKCNLFFLIGDEPVNCVIESNNSFIAKVMVYISALDMEVRRICNLIKNDKSIELTNIDIENLTNHIKLLLQDSKFCSDLAELNYKDEFINFLNIVNLNIGAEERELLEKHLVDIQSKQTEIEKKEKENAKELYALTKQYKDVLKDIFGKLSIDF